MQKIIFLIMGLAGSLFSGVLNNYSQVCPEGDGNSCYQLGIAYRNGDGVRINAVATRQFLEIACGTGNTQAYEKLKTKSVRDVEWSQTKTREQNVQMQSVYTKSDDKSCKIIQSYNHGNSSVSACPGYAGIKVEISENDIRQDMILIRNGKRYDLHFMDKISRAFSFFAPTIEWRFEKGKPNKPVAMISRYVAADKYVNGLQKDVSYHVVTKITDAQICIVGKVYPGKDQNIKAREMADKAKMMTCVDYSQPQVKREAQEGSLGYLKQYTNARFGFTLSYPNNLFVLKRFSDNGDGITLYNSDKSLELRAYGSWYGDDIRQIYRDEQGWAKDAGQKVTYKVLKKNWFVLSGTDRQKRTIFYLKTYFKDGKSVSFRLEYPLIDKAKYNSLVSMINKSFKIYGE